MASPSRFKPWTPAEVNQLWDGTMEQVAKKLNRTKQSVSVARTAYKRFKPGTGLIATEENFKAPAKKAAPKKAAPKKSAPAKRKYTARKKSAIDVIDVADLQRTDSFKMEFNGQKLEFPNQPKSIRLNKDGLEVDF